jgi:hypothetical protein
MLDLDAYFRYLETLARASIDSGVAVHEFIEKPGTHATTVAECIACRESLLTSEDEKELSGYLVIGLFRGMPRRRRLAAFALSFDVQYEADRLEIRSQCEPYDRAQPLFAGAPELFDHIRRTENGSPDLELIAGDAVHSMSGSGIYQAGNGFTRLCPFLSPGIVNWARSSYPGRASYIRLDPYSFHDTQPLQLLTEATLVPANPRWLHDFSLRRGMKEFAAYTLLDRPPSVAPAEFWDYRIRQMRRLEVHVQRREDNYLSMLIEELPRPDDPNTLMIARCIHLDTRDPAFTPLSEVSLQHLDLAINVYAAADRERRFNHTLQNGKVQDATYRTHLFRIEGAPFVALFDFCQMFLRSRVLLSEWLNELFTES